MKTSYDPETFPLLAEKYARDGLNDKQIYANLGISCSTFYEYQNRHPEFREALKRGKKPANIQVENALFKKAIGQEYEEKTIETELDAGGTPRVSKIRTVKKYIPPDLGAIVFWLKNRCSDEWKDKKEVDMTNPFLDLMKGAAVSVETGEETTVEILAEDGKVNDDKDGGKK